MSYVLLFVLMLFLTGGFCALLWISASKQRKQVVQNLEKRQKELQAKREHAEKIKQALGETVPAQVLQERFVEMQVVDEALRAERGRITITEAEMETVEVRLRELEEIEREIEASGLETKEEQRILQKKFGELRKNMEALQSVLTECGTSLDTFLGTEQKLGDLEEKLIDIRKAMTSTMEQGENVLKEIQFGNDQYFTMKTRYDALDIEYAQLYEKFSAESAQKEKETK